MIRQIRLKYMNKVKVSLKELEDLRYRILCKFPGNSDNLQVLTIKEFAGLLKRKDIDIELEIEEETTQEAEE